MRQLVKLKLKTLSVGLFESYRPLGTDIQECQVLGQSG